MTDEVGRGIGRVKWILVKGLVLKHPMLELQSKITFDCNFMVTK